jgi:hypothetical protein
MAQFRRLLSISSVFLFALLFSECSSDSIPSTPPEPYLFDTILFGNGITPAPGTALSRGQNITLHLNIAYTLAPQLSSIRNRLAMYVQAFGRDSTNAAFGIGARRDSFLLASSSGSVVADSLSINIPQSIVSVKVQAFIDSIPFRNPVLLIDSTSWTVQ